MAQVMDPAAAIHGFWNKMLVADMVAESILGNVKILFRVNKKKISLTGNFTCFPNEFVNQIIQRSWAN